MTRDRIMEIIQAHGLYCIPRLENGIALTDKNGNVYDVIFLADDNKSLIIDENTMMSLYDWLGY